MITEQTDSSLTRCTRYMETVGSLCLNMVTLRFRRNLVSYLTPGNVVSYQTLGTRVVTHVTRRILLLRQDK